MDKANVTHGRAGEQALKWAITEFNASNTRVRINNVEGTGTHSFFCGQHWAMMFGVGMERGAFTMTPWSIHESDGNRSNYDLGYLDGVDPVTPRSSYYHEMLMAENFKGNFAKSATNQSLVKSIASKDIGQVTVMLLNMDLNAIYNYSVRLDNVIFSSSSALKIQVDTGIPREFNLSLKPQSTQVLVFDLQGNLIKKCEYTITDAQQAKPPVCTNAGNTVARMAHDNKQEVSDVLIYPNPSNASFVTVTLPGEEVKQVNTAIKVVQGKTVATEKVIGITGNKFQLSTQGIGVGLYLLEISSENGRVWQVKLLIE
jgi:hypothetical protein